MKVSVVIPTHNRYELLKRALTSIYLQKYLADEIIIVDDGSTDNTAQIQKDFPQIIYIYQENAGVSSSRNVGIRKAKNEWIAFLDSDDEWHEEKLQVQVNFHMQNENILMSYTDETWIRNEKEVKIPKKFQKIAKDVFLENISYCNIAPSSALLHRSIFETIGLFDENLEVCEDYDLWLRIAQKHHIGLLNQKLIRKYAGHEDQLSFKHWGMDRFRVQSLEKLLDTKEKYYEEIKNELIEKYELLLKGALKYDREEDVLKYKEKLGKILN